MKIKIKDLRLLIRESSSDINKAASEFRTTLQEIPAPQFWMRFRRVKTYPRWNEVTALHGFILRCFRHEDEDYGSYDDSAWQEFDAWENATWEVIDKLKKKYPGIQFGTAAD